MGCCSSAEDVNITHTDLTGEPRRTHILLLRPSTDSETAERAQTENVRKQSRAERYRLTREISQKLHEVEEESTELQEMIDMEYKHQMNELDTFIQQEIPNARQAMQFEDLEIWMLRFIISYQCDMDTVKKAFKQMIEWRMEHKTWEIPERLHCDSPHKHRIATRHFWPYRGLHGPSRNGELVSFNLMGKLDVPQYVRMVSQEDHKEELHFSIITEARELNEMSREEGRFIQFMLVFDLEGLSKRHFSYMDNLNYDLMISQVITPGTLSRTFVINCPKIFSMAWSMMKPWIDPYTVKSVFLFSDGIDKIRDEIDEYNLPEYYGGKCRCYENSWWVNRECIPFATKHISIDAGDVYVENIPIEFKESQIDYELYVESNDVNLSIDFIDESRGYATESLLDPVKCTTKKEVAGQFHVEGPGVLCFRLSNESSKWISSRVSLVIK